MIAQYFVEFIFYSFLGWVWESIYCTINEKKWCNRGFLFGPICPIYGSSVVLAHIVFRYIPGVKDPSFPIWGVFLVCMLGSAVMEFGTSYYLEKRFHATWWDYSHLPLNIQGRICLQVSIGFGVAGVVIVKFVLPLTNQVQTHIPVILSELLAILLAGLIGADMALTEASLSSLIKEIEAYKLEFDARAEETYTSVSQKFEESVARYQDGAQARSERMKELSNNYLQRMTRAQRQTLNKLKRIDTRERLKKFEGMSATEYLKNVLQKMDIRK